MSSPGALELTLDDKSALRRAYMPFIRNGGVFVRTDHPYELGDDIAVTIRLFDARKPIGIKGTVVWVTPTRAQGKRAAGVGVRFGADETYRARIEGLLDGISDGDEPTHTL
ncbi:MAG: PilZ domain-containing protein [Rhodospirillaceae bacterium]|nr:PilZ domain-containing protein [Rhodospirillaceae bacterium]